MSAIDLAIIDDHPMTSRLIRLFLRNTPLASVNLVHLMTLEQACAHLGAEPPGLILLDNRLPPFKSFQEPVEELLSLGVTAPIVLYTAMPPLDIDQHPLRDRLADIWLKDEMEPETFAERLAPYFPAAG